MNQDATRTSLEAGRILPDGKILADRYRIERLLGVGAMGMVYLAHDQQLSIDVALKVLRADGAGRELSLERFRSELVLARQISHRNVIRIHDIGQAEDLYFITMDYVDGQSLKQLLDIDGKIPAERAAAITADLADALAEAHRAGVVHRDVKPANVLIADDRALLTDFGIARSLHAEGLTQTGEIVGTLDYLSPEQARGQKVDGRSDIYSLGLLLYEMLSGQRPFTGETAEEVLAQRTLASPREIKDVTVSATLQKILKRCLAVEPADRYQDAAELASDLRSGSASRNWRKPLRTAGIGAALLVIIGGSIAIWSTWFSGPGGSAVSGEPIAVLPFAVAVDSADLASVSHGLAELLAEQLAAGADVPVVAAERVTGTMRDLRLSPDNLQQSDQVLLGDLLDAGYLVAGRLQQVNDTFHLEARLRRADTGDVVHRAMADVADVAGVFGSIEALAAELLANLDVELDAAGSLTANVDPAALGAYASGVNLLSQGNALDAVEPLQAATTAAPGFALAWDRLAEAYAIVGKDQDALAAAESAVAALEGRGGRGAALIRARKEALAGNLDDAVPILEALLGEIPGDVEVRQMLAETYGDAGRLQDAETQMQQVVANSPDHPQAWYLLGKYSILQGNARRAVDDYLVKALVIQNRLGNDQGKADVLNALGIAESELGDESSATSYYQQALELRRKIGDDRGVAAVLANLARINLRNGRYDEARQELIAARDQLGDIGDRWTVANLENELGFLEEQRGRFADALGHYRESLRLRDQLGDRRALAESYNNIGYTYYLLGEYDNAEIFIERSLSTYRDTGNVEGVMLASQASGILDTARGRYDNALKAFLEALAISRDLSDVSTEAVTEGYIGIARFLQGQYAAAADSYTSSTDKLRELGDTRGLAQFTLHHARLSLAAGMLEPAQEAIEAATQWLKNDDNAAAQALLLRVEASWLHASGEQAQAIARFAAALDEARKTGEDVAILQARLQHARSFDLQARIAELQDIRTTAERIGHGELEFESTLATAAAQFEDERFAEAERALKDVLRGALVASGYHGSYRGQLLLADALSAQGKSGDAATAYSRAAEMVDRALSAQNDEQQRSFRTLPAVRRILEHRSAASET